MAKPRQRRRPHKVTFTSVDRIRGIQANAVIIDEIAEVDPEMIDRVISQWKKAAGRPKPFSQLGPVGVRHYFLAAFKHIWDYLPEMAQELLKVAERGLWGEATEEEVKNAEAVVMSHIIVGLGFDPQRLINGRRNGFDWDDVHVEVNRHLKGRGRLDHQIMLACLATVHGHVDLSGIGARNQTAYFMGRVRKRNNEHNWHKLIGAELTWLAKLRQDMWPPLKYIYPGMVDQTLHQLAVSLAKGEDCAFALADALEESHYAGDGAYVLRAKKHFRKTPHHPLGCKYLDCLLDMSNVTKPEARRPLLVVDKPYDLVDEAGNVVGKSTDLLPLWNSGNPGPDADQPSE